MTAKRRKTSTSRKERSAPFGPAPAIARPGWQPILPPLLALLSLAALWPVLQSEFVVLDDDAYVYSNPVVRNGLKEKTGQIEDQSSVPRDASTFW